MGRRFHIGDKVICSENELVGRAIRFYTPTSCEEQTVVLLTMDGREYHAPTRTWVRYKTGLDASAIFWDEFHLENPYLRHPGITIDEEEHLLISSSPTELWDKEKLKAFELKSSDPFEAIEKKNLKYQAELCNDINTAEFVRGLRNIAISFAESSHIDVIEAEIYIDRAIENSRSYGISMEEAVSRLRSTVTNKDIK